MMRMKSKTQLSMAVALALALGGCVPVWAANLNNQKLEKGDWNLQEKLQMEHRQVTANQISLDGTNIPAEDAPVSMNMSSLEGKKGIGFSNLKVLHPLAYSSTEGVNLEGSSLMAPTISISQIETVKDNQASSFFGIRTNVAADDANQKNVPNQLKTDWLHVDGVTTDTALQVYGAYLGPTELSPYTEGGNTNVTAENVSNTTDSPDGVLAFGLGNNLALFGLKNAEDSKDIPFVVTGKTQIRNISSAKGSAVGTVLYGISGFDMEDSHTDFHDLEISDIHGGDLSVGLYGGMGVVNVENADINMTGKQNEYAGLYTASEPDYQSASLQQFAIAGPFQGNINLSNPEGTYIINGNVLADAGNHLQIHEAQYQFYKKKYEDSSASEKDEEEIKEIKAELDALTAAIPYERQMGKINLAGHLKLYGDVYAKDGGTVNLHLQEGSYFEGQADDYADYDGAGQLTPRQVDVSSDLNKSALGILYGWQSEEDDDYARYGVPRLNSGTINLTMDPGSKWQTRGKSFLTSLNFNGGGLVDTRKGHGVSVTIGKLTGEGGTFLMDFSKDAAKSDMLYVRDLSQSGVQHIQAYLLPDTRPEDLKGLRFATTGGDDYKRDPAAKFDVSLAKDQGVNNITLKVKNEKFNPDDVVANEKFNGGKNGVGTYKPGNAYVTATFSGQSFTKKVPDQEKIMKAALGGEQTTDDKGNLLPEYMKEVTLESPAKEGTNWFVDEAVVTPSDSGKVIKKSMQLNYMNAIYGIYTDSLEKRLGEARYSGDGDGLWARVRHDRVGRNSLYEASNTMTELGFDWRNDLTTFGRHIQGAALDYMDGSADYKEVTGNSDSKRYGLWFYDTRLGNKGHYTDLVAKYGRLQNKYTLYPEMGDTVKGNYHHDYWSLSFEYGRKKTLASDWFIEPQAQLQYTYLSSTSYRTSQDTQVHLAGTDSLISRLGFRLGRDISDRTSFYITGDFFHEFLGDQDVSAWDRTGRMDVTGHNDGSWYNAGLGFTTRVGKNSYAYASFDRSFGPHVDRTWTLEAGVNFRF